MRLHGLLTAALADPALARARELAAPGTLDADQVDITAPASIRFSSASAESPAERPPVSPREMETGSATRRVRPRFKSGEICCTLTVPLLSTAEARVALNVVNT